MVGDMTALVTHLAVTDPDSAVWYAKVGRETNAGPAQLLAGPAS